MSKNKPIKITFHDHEIAEIHKAIAEITLDLMEDGIVVTYLNDEQGTPILPSSVHAIKSLPHRSHLQYKLGIKALTQKDALIPAMVVVKLKSKLTGTYPWPVRVIYALLHEYSHVKTVHLVDRPGDCLALDQEDCEFKCVEYMRDYLLQRFDKSLAEKIWLYAKVYICCAADSHYNKASVWTLDLHDFEE